MTGICILRISKRFLFEISKVSTTSALVTSGCHSLWVQLVSWTGDGEDWEGDDCDTWLTGIDCDPVFYICMDKKNAVSTQLLMKSYLNIRKVTRDLLKGT